MMKFVAVFLLFHGLALGQELKSATGELIQANDSIRKNNLSIELLDDRTGISLVGLTINLWQADMDEVFVGGGTMLVAFTATIGWKHYYKEG